MNRHERHIFRALMILAALAMVVPQTAQATGTASGTTISNKATVNYQVGGVSQAPIESSPTGNSTSGVGNGTSTTFKVDNKVNVVVTKNSDATVIAGSTNQTLVFTVTNSGNTAQRYALSVTNGAGIVMNNVRIYLDNGTTPNAFDGSDTAYVNAATFGDVAEDGTLKILVVADTPASATNGQTSDYNLIATTVDAGTTNVTTQTAGADNPAVVDVVFTDAAGTAAGDAARDGKHSASGRYTVSAATLTVTKTSAVYSDPFNGTTSPKAIPGAIITYTVTITNAAGGANATNVSIADDLSTEMPAVNPHLAFQTTFNDGTNTCAGAQGIVVGGVCKTNTNDADGADWNLTASKTVTVTGLTVNAGTSTTVKYQVIVQ